MYILGIETSCDETACAIVKDGTKEIVNVVSSSRDLHEKTGGVVPEIAARKQMEFFVPVLAETMKKFNKPVEKIEAVAVTVGPGLIGSLLVGVAGAKALALAWEKPLIPVNHLLGHIYANFVDNTNEINFPAVALVVSGGHTDLVLMRGHGEYDYLGGTLDDAAGEAFDKTARLLGLAKYLGGAELSRTAMKCSNNTISGMLPRPMMDKKGYDFSFSGLKTAVKRVIEQDKAAVEVIACEFENAVADVLVSKTINAAKEYKVKTLLLGGGVAANKQLRTRMQTKAERLGVDFHVPPPKLCTDNAVYIAGAAYFNQLERPLDRIQACPSMGIMDKV